MEICKEILPVWDNDKINIFSDYNCEENFSFNLKNLEIGKELPGEWFRLFNKSSVIGYGWISMENISDPIYENYPEISICIGKKFINQGFGKYLLSELINILKTNFQGVQVRINRSNNEYGKVNKVVTKLGFSDFENFIDCNLETNVSTLGISFNEKNKI